MSLKNTLAVVLGIIVILLLYMSFYTVQQTERAVLLRFGAVLSCRCLAWVAFETAHCRRGENHRGTGTDGRFRPRTLLHT